MAERWTSEQMAASEPPRSRVPTWVWFTGAGCLAAVVLLVALIWTMVSMYKEAQDPQVQWARVAKVLPHEARPADWEILGFPVPMGGLSIWVFHRRDASEQVVLWQFLGESVARARASLFDPASFGKGGDGGTAIAHTGPVQAGTIAVQGRELRSMRFTATPKREERFIDFARGEGVEQKLDAITGASVLVELTPAASPYLIVIMLTHESQVQPIADQDVVDFLAPFRIGDLK